MKRYVSLEEISDGKLYGANDMVKADCHDCTGCFKCCTGMGASIVLDPMDIHAMTRGLNMDFSRLMEKYIELNVVDGIILPNLKMSETNDRCGFLNEQGRCSIHSFRPGICRLFPLGRYYEDNGFKYFLQIGQCHKEDRSKIKVKKWLDIPDLKSYENYICTWHTFINNCESAMETLEDDQIRIFNMYILKVFYQTPFTEDFYIEFNQRIQQVKDTLSLE